MRKTVFVSHELPDSIRGTLEKSDCRIINVPENPYIAAPVKAHPDMSLCRIGNTVVAAPHIANDVEIYRAVTSAGCRFVGAKTPQSESYPHDCAYNVLSLDNCIVCNTKAAAPEVLDAAREQGLKTVHVPQGYAACSTLNLNGRAIITADAKIYSAARENNIDALLIRAGHIALDGYACGFIGGASAVVGTDVIFFGDPYTHPDGEKITDFLKLNGCRAVVADKTPLYDFGGAAVLN